MVEKRQLSYRDAVGELHVALQNFRRELIDSVRDISIWPKTKPKTSSGSNQTHEGDSTMSNYRFQFEGGAKLINKANYKFHAFVVDTQAVEHHLFGAIKNGLVNAQGTVTEGRKNYWSAVPIIKVFSATSGFGIPKEYFSYFIALDSSIGKMISILPLGYEKITSYNWQFVGQGRFLKKEEIRRFFGHTSDTWKFYQRQSFLSRNRLQKLVKVQELSEFESGETKQTEEVRMLRFD